MRPAPAAAPPTARDNRAAVSPSLPSRPPRAPPPRRRGAISRGTGRVSRHAPVGRGERRYKCRRRRSGFCLLFSCSTLFFFDAFDQTPRKVKYERGRDFKAKLSFFYFFSPRTERGEKFLCCLSLSLSTPLPPPTPCRYPACAPLRGRRSPCQVRRRKPADDKGGGEEEEFERANSTMREWFQLLLSSPSFSASSFALSLSLSRLFLFLFLAR